MFIHVYLMFTLMEAAPQKNLSRLNQKNSRDEIFFWIFWH